MRVFTFALAFLVLTALTQIGGLVLGVTAILARALGWRGAARGFGLAALFLAIYAASSLLLVPPLAALGGRVALPCAGEPLRVMPLFCALNRHYAAPRVVALAETMAADMEQRFPDTTTLVLDASFPFLDGFPMLPHLSHDDGLKLDLAYFYAGPDGRYLPGGTRSPIGYWAFEQPDPGEARDCPPTWLTGRWDLSFLQPLLPDLPLEPQRTRAALQWLVEEGPSFGLTRIFVEPYLATRLGVRSPLLRFQGCRAARHDDHIHLEVR